jgi:hypothetical protein
MRLPGDMRGTIYAIYQFSQTVLGVDPMDLVDGQAAGETRLHHRHPLYPPLLGVKNSFFMGLRRGGGARLLQ